MLVRLIVLSSLLCCSGFVLANSGAQDSFTSQIQLVDDPSDFGPYRVGDISSDLRDRDYSSAKIYYPQAENLRDLPATTLSGGLTNSKEQMSWLATRLASHGIVTIVFTPTNRFSSSPLTWEKGHKAAFRNLIEKNRDANSTLFRMIDEQRIAMTGYSLGGAGGILAANERDYPVRAVVGICAYNPITATKNVPHLFITGTRDVVASPTRILRTFRAMTKVKTRAYAKFNGLDHLDPINFGGKHELMARYIISWLKVYLSEDNAYYGFLAGDQLDEQLGNRNVFASPKDYIFYN